MKAFHLTPIGLLIVLCSAVAGMVYFSGGLTGPTSLPEPVTLGMTPHEANTLVYIAEDRGFFIAHGINVTTLPYDSGAAAVEGMLRGESDMAAASDFVIVGHALKKEPIRSIGTIGRNQNEYIFGRSDRGISTVADLSGKRIGVPRGTAAEFYLGRFLNLHGVGVSQVTLVDTNLSRGVGAIVSGDVDAVITWQPYARSIGEKLGNNTVSWPAQSGQVVYWNAVTTDSWIESHPDPAARFLASLADAESFVIRHPDETKAIVQKRLGYDDGYMDAIWPENQFTLSLDQAFVLALEDESRWMIANNLTNATAVPDFVDYVYIDGMEAVRPGSVNIIR